MSKKLNVLCLHGFRTSGEILKWQGKELFTALEKHCNFLFLNAPHKSKGEPYPLVKEFFEPPYFEWFNANDNTGVYEGFQESISFIESKTFSAFYGEIDGIIGFSQGATIGHILAEKGKKEGHLLWSKLKFILLFAGYPAKDKNLAHWYEGPKLTISSYHVWGSEDIDFRDRSTDLWNRRYEGSKSSKKYIHCEGHMFPKKDVDKPIYNKISKFISKLMPKSII